MQDFKIGKATPLFERPNYTSAHERIDALEDFIMKKILVRLSNIEGDVFKLKNRGDE